MDQSAGPVYGFGPFRYDAAQRLLFREGELVPLMPKALEMLHVLLNQRGRVVEKSQLMKLVWPDTQVEDVGLARNISLLRKALGDETENGAYIETIPRRGYRFVAPVQIIGPENVTVPSVEARRPKRWWIAALTLVAFIGVIYWQFYQPSRFLTGGPGLANLAVVPFESLSPELDRAAFPQGLCELLVTDLSKFDGIHVVSPSTVRRHQRFRISMGLMGRLLGLDVLVEGTVQRVAEQVRITPRLVDVHTGKVIWAESYDYPVTDLGQVQSGAAQTIAAQVGAHLAIHGQFPHSTR
ncbi:MAG TPA: winged helix-turn-helix domain-containing protein [Bryobacteraceae bacterium]|nr:winged helix-turn-helix domain-containing protein [Bryobacteraceae bacterium]